MSPYDYGETTGPDNERSHRMCGDTLYAYDDNGETTGTCSKRCHYTCMILV